MLCLHCQFDNPQGARFCAGCGVPLAGAGGPRPERRPAPPAADSPSAGAGTAFVGREEELARLLAFTEGMVERPQPHLGVVVGEPGIGKTRLVEEYLGGLRAAGNPSPVAAEGEGPLYVGRQVTVLRGEALPYGGRPYEPLVAPLRRIFQLEDEEAKEARWEKIGRGVRVLFPWEDSEERHYIAQSIGFLLSVSFEGSLLAPLEPRQVRGRIFRSLRKVLASLARKGPLVLVLDDLHWADGPTMEFLESAVTFVEDAPLLVLMVSRGSGRVPGKLRAVLNRAVGKGLPCLEIVVAGLETGESRRLVGTLLETSGDDLPTQELSARVADWSGGNPFYAEELSKGILDRSLDPVSVVTAALPPTVHGVVASRIDNLDAVARRVVRTAAVAGVMFWKPLLEVLLSSEIEPAGLAGALAALEDRGIVAPFPAAPDAWRFRHAFLQEVAYAGVPREERMALHARAGRWLEERFSGRREEALEVLALHFTRAGDAARALHYTWMAADRARAAYDLDRAGPLYGEALALAGSVPEDGREGLERPLLEYQARATEGRAWVKDLAGAHRRAAELFQKALEMEEQGGAPAERLAELEGEVARAYQARGDYDLAGEHYERAGERLGDSGDRVVRAKLRLGEAKILIRKGKTEEALEKTSGALALVSPDGEEASEAYDNLGLLYYYRGPRSRAIEYWVRSLDIRTRLGLTAKVATSWNNLGAAYQGEGDYTRALDAFGRSLQISEQVGDLYQGALLHNNLGVIHLDRGELDEAGAAFHEALDLSSSTGNRYVETLAWNNLAELRIALGRWEEAEESLDRCQELAQSMGSRGFLPDIHRLRGCLGLVRGDAEEALRQGEKALETGRETGSRADEANACRLIGEARCILGDLEAAAEAFDRALAMHREVEDRPNLARTCRAYGLLLGEHPGLSDGAGAVTLLGEAREIFSSLGMRREMEATPKTG